LGFIAGKYLQVRKESIAPLLIYIVTPIVIFNGVVTTPITLSNLSLPILFYILCCIIAGVFYFLSGFIWKDATRNLLGYTAGMGNIGYFGLPVALVLFDKNLIGITILCILGFTLFSNSIGFYIVAKGTHTASQAIKKVLTLPTLYAFFLGLIVNILKIHFNSTVAGMIANFTGAFTILGMLIIGLGLADIKNFKFDFKFIFSTFFAKFIVWPLLVLFIIFLDTHTIMLYGRGVQKVMILMSIVPLASDAITFASLLHVHPEKASLAVLLSTIFALFYIPLIAIYFIK
jgi:predicted permease